MKILVFGSGAIGGYLGGRLALANHELSFVTRPTKAAILNKDGLRLTEGEKEEHVIVTAYGSLGEALSSGMNYDLVLLTMKSYDLEVAIAEMSPYRFGMGSLMSLQNGIGIEPLIQQAFPYSPIVAGSLTTPVKVNSVSHLTIERSDRGLGIAPTISGQDMTIWQQLWEDAGVNTSVLDDAKEMKWSKLFLNILGNATSAILNMHPGEIYANRAGFQIELGMLQECLQIMDRLDLGVVNFPGAPAKQLSWAVRSLPSFLLRPAMQRQIAKGRGGKMPSFYVDLHYGKGKSEVIYHNGAVARAAKGIGINVPINQQLNDILMGMMLGEIPLTRYNMQPEKLWADIQQGGKSG